MQHACNGASGPHHAQKGHDVRRYDARQGDAIGRDVMSVYGIYP